MIMRVEIALIGGIVCFCCWCAYILINMNSTVTIPTQITQQQADHRQYHLAQQPSQSLPLAAIDRINKLDNANNKRLMQQMQHPYAQDPNHITGRITQSRKPSIIASAGPNTAPSITRMPAANTPAAYYTSLSQGQLTGSPADYNHHKSYRTAAIPPQQYMAPELRAAQPVAEAQVSSAANLPERHYYYGPDSANRWTSSVPRTAYQQQIYPRRRQKRRQWAYNPPEGHEQAATSPQDDDQEPEAIEEEAQEEEDDEYPVRHTNEGVGARSFSEHQAEANERDRYGRPVRAHHRHLINGRPAEAQAAAAADFEAVANELDPDEGEEQPEEAAASGDGDREYDDEPSPAQSRTLSKLDDDAATGNQATERKSATATTLSRRMAPYASDRRHGSSYNGAKKRATRRPLESHQHRLSESLSAQQWDEDDATRSPSNKSVSSFVPSAADEGTPLEDTTTETPMTEAEAVADEESPDDTDMFVGTDKFPFLESQDKRRRRRRKRETKGLLQANLANGLPKHIRITTAQNNNPLSPLFTQKRRMTRSTTADWPLSDPGTPEVARVPDIDHSSEFTHSSSAAEPAGTSADAPQAYARPPDGFLHHPGGHFESSEPAIGGRSVQHEDKIVGLDDLNIRIMAEPNHDRDETDYHTAIPSQSPAEPDAEAPARWPLPDSSYPPTTARRRLPPPPPPISMPYSRDTDYGRHPEDIYQNGHSQGGAVILEYQTPPVRQSAATGSANYGSTPLYSMGGRGRYDNGMGLHTPEARNPLASSHKLKRKKFKRSKMAEEKYKAAKAHKLKKSSKYKRAGMKKARKKAKKKMAKSSKQFKGATRGKKAKKGHGQQGAKKGALYYKDKGYKKRGFKKAYKKVEAGDHKTYFDEFRDKDHNKKWKNYKDKHDYSQSKVWAGNDMKKYKDYDEHQMKHKKSGSGGSREKSRSKFKHDYKYKNDYSKKKKKKKKFIETE